MNDLDELTDALGAIPYTVDVCDAGPLVTVWAPGGDPYDGELVASIDLRQKIADFEREAYALRLLLEYHGIECWPQWWVGMIDSGSRKCLKLHESGLAKGVALHYAKQVGRRHDTIELAMRGRSVVHATHAAWHQAGFTLDDDRRRRRGVLTCPSPCETAYIAARRSTPSDGSPGR